MKEKIVTRFAPSPTGFLHIGGARTALFNYMFAKHMGGKFLLRIEDTDTQRSTEEATCAILDGLKWLQLAWDGDFVLQSSQRRYHQQVAKTLLDQGKAYYCDAAAKINPTGPGGAMNARGKAIRLKVDKTGSSSFKDLVLGTITVQKTEIEDFVILRSDGTPTYNLACVVDDITMGVTHVIRGNDHLTNTFKQIELYKALGKDLPHFAHIPLIHGPDGSKLSKRHGALSVLEYQNMGYLPNAITSYLMKLGWSNGNDEIIPMQDAIPLFQIEKIQKSAARFDFGKLASVNAHYIKNYDLQTLSSLLMPFIELELEGKRPLPSYKQNLIALLPFLQARFSTLKELAKAAVFILVKDYNTAPEAQDVVTSSTELLQQYVKMFEPLEDFSRPQLHTLIKQYAEENNLKLNNAVAPLRAALTGEVHSPASVFDIMSILGKEETLNRLTR